MSKGEEIVSKEPMKTGGTEAALKTELSVEGELSCVLVFSEKRHVEYIYPLLSQIENVLGDRGFNPQRLGKEIRSGEDYLDKLEKIVEDCVLGVVILDGFRPNVLFEFGFLKGKRKPIIILQSIGACISVKTLYKSIEDSGLTNYAFNKRLCDPSIDISFHFSDFAGKHIEYIDLKARETDPNHPYSVLRKELDKNEAQIIEEIKKVKTKNIPSKYIQEFMEPIVTVIKNYYANAKICDINDLKNTYTKIKSIIQKYYIKVPYEVYSMIAATYVSKAEVIKLDVKKIVDCFNSAIEIYKELLKSISIEDDPTLYADTKKKLGDIYWELSKYRDPKEYRTRAIKAYEEGLKVHTLEQFPMDYAMTQNNLGNAYGTLADVEDRAENCKKAIEAFEEALKVRTLEQFPMDYAMTQNNLGNAYHTLAEVEDRAENCKKAIKAYNEALKVYTKEKFPEIYQLVELNLRRLIEFCGTK